MPFKLLHRWIPAIAFLGFSTAISNPAHANDKWPEKPIRIVVPLTAGGPSDILLRPVAAELQKILGQPVYVENKPGANGSIGVTEVIKSAPDGYTWLWSMDTPMTINPHIYQKIGYKNSEIKPINIAASFSQFLACHPQAGLKTIEDLKTSKDKVITYASGGSGSPGHMLMEAFVKQSQIMMTHVPYRGAPQAVQSLVGGQVDCGFLAGPTVIPFIQNQRLVALATSGEQRSPLAPEVPTIAQSGLAGFEGSFWIFMAVSEKVPASVQTKMHAALQQVLQRPDIHEKAHALDMKIHGSTQQAAQQKYDHLYNYWQGVAQSVGLKVD
ncbi:MAG: Bug family tripartite tricarboxylate transporter substrate binding protein [Comamonas sp.]